MKPLAHRRIKTRIIMATQHNNTEDKKPTSISSSRKQPLKSGKVKGPMGVGRKRKPKTRATVKEPSKGKTSLPEQASEVSRTSADGAAEKHESNGSNLSPAPSLENRVINNQPKERLPERTTKESEALRIVESKRTQKETQAQHELASGEPIELSESTQTEMRGMENQTAADQESASTKSNLKTDKTEEPDEASKNKEESMAEDTSMKGAKKMSRQKFVKGISAEEKLKLDNVSPSQELKNRITDATSGLRDALEPGQEIKDQIAELLLQVIPSQENVPSSTLSKQQMDKITETISSMFNNGLSMDEILAMIPNENIREQLREVINRTRKNT